MDMLFLVVGWFDFFTIYSVVCVIRSKAEYRKAVAAAEAAEAQREAAKAQREAEAAARKIEREEKRRAAEDAKAQREAEATARKIEREEKRRADDVSEAKKEIRAFLDDYAAKYADEEKRPNVYISLDDFANLASLVAIAHAEK